MCLEKPGSRHGFALHINQNPLDPRGCQRSGMPGKRVNSAENFGMGAVPRLGKSRRYFPRVCFCATTRTELLPEPMQQDVPDARACSNRRDQGCDRYRLWDRQTGERGGNARRMGSRTVGGLGHGEHLRISVAGDQLSHDVRLA